MSTPPDPSTSATLAPRPGPASKVRLRFSKGGSLRWLSHHDLMRAFERLLRRCALPFRRTQGFHPHPRLVFALSLPLGVVGCAEVAELELDENLTAEEVSDRLRAACPPGLEVLAAHTIAPSTTARVRGLCYGVALPEGRAEAVRPLLAEFLAARQWWIERRRPSGGQASRRLDLRAFVRDLRLTDEPTWLEMDLWLTPAGTARPEEVLNALQLHDVLEAGGVLHRLRLELEDDSPTQPAGSA